MKTVSIGFKKKDSGIGYLFFTEGVVKLHYKVFDDNIPGSEELFGMNQLHKKEQHYVQISIRMFEGLL